LVYPAMYSRLEDVQIAGSARGFRCLWGADPRWLRGQV